MTVMEVVPVNEFCPFCGEKPLVDTLNYTSGKPGRFRIECCGCGANTRWYDTEAEAWKAWNNRYVKMCNELRGSVFNPDAFIYEGLLYFRHRQSLCCYAQKEIRGGMKRISKGAFLTAYQEAAIAQAEEVNTECEKTVGKVKG
jgi:Lar family restriction alleviation protein